MTEEKRFLTADDRDDVAIWVNSSAADLERLLSTVPFDYETRIALSDDIIKLHKSLRILEQNRAITKAPTAPLKERQLATQIR